MKRPFLNFNLHSILNLIPHRYPFLLIDRILSYKNQNSIRVLKNISLNDPLLQGHFPSKFIFPGVLTIESISQSAIALSLLNHPEHNHAHGIYCIIGIEKTRFKKFIIPGDQLIITVTIKKEYKNLFFFKGYVHVNNDLVCYTNIICKYVVNIL
ncbi:3-hydroxyacyl-ACP dehydratase FabZ [Buchnera aphidicola]|uniref:3-hydroxyacyl-ACP dehydratase FabZ n=1 Tax=Buchnera aphidicola TaxID=9 RepID=UPI003464B44A